MGSVSSYTAPVLPSQAVPVGLEAYLYNFENGFVPCRRRGKLMGREGAAPGAGGTGKTAALFLFLFSLVTVGAASHKACVCAGFGEKKGLAFDDEKGM